MNEQNHDCDGCDKSGRPAKNARPGESTAQRDERQAIMARLCRIKRRIIVLSGKGGVGKTTVAANLALSLAAQGFATGLLDVDIHGPSVPNILGLQGAKMEVFENRILPVPVGKHLKVMSVGFLLKNPDDAVVWKGPLKRSVIAQFLKDVEWGDLDFLVIDCPPGTGDEPLSVIQLMERLDGAVVVTTPQELAVADVRRSIQFCRTVKVPVLGVIENMSGFVCPHCGETTDVFKSGGGERMAREMDVPFLGRIPLDPAIAEASDRGEPYIQTYAGSVTARAFAAALEPLVRGMEKK